MEAWVESFVAFVNNDREFDFGTSSVDEIKVVTPEGTIEVQKDERWESLVKLGEVFANAV